MSRFAPTRRELVRGTLLTAVSVLAGARASAQGMSGGTPVDPNVRFRAITVDVSPIASHGGAAVGARLAAVLRPQLRKVFADRLAPGDRRAAVLTARMTTVFLTFYEDRTSDFGFGNNDTIEGEGIVSDGQRVLSTTHVLTELPASYSGGPRQPGIEDARFQAISYQFAYWLRREMGL